MAEQVAGSRDGCPSVIVWMTRCSIVMRLCAADQVNITAGAGAEFSLPANGRATRLSDVGGTPRMKAANDDCRLKSLLSSRVPLPGFHSQTSQYVEQCIMGSSCVFQVRTIYATDSVGVVL